MTRLPVETRFWSKVHFEPMSGCWLWGSEQYDGYGRFRIGTKQVRAHRYSYELHKGKIPAGMVLDHVCRNRICCNPDHLRPCTIAENILADGSLTRAAQNSRRTCCSKCNGVYAYETDGHRYCPACKRVNSRKYKARKRGRQ